MILFIIIIHLSLHGSRSVRLILSASILQIRPEAGALRGVTTAECFLAAHGARLGSKLWTVGRAAVKEWLNY